MGSAISWLTIEPGSFFQYILLRDILYGQLLYLNIFLYHVSILRYALIFGRISRNTFLLADITQFLGQWCTLKLGFNTNSRMMFQTFFPRTYCSRVAPPLYKCKYDEI